VFDRAVLARRVKWAFAGLIALFGWSASASADPPAPFETVDACRQYLVDHPTGPLAEQAFRCVVEAELPAAGDQGGRFRSLMPQTDIY
jgi:hypothetical protein